MKVTRKRGLWITEEERQQMKPFLRAQLRPFSTLSLFRSHFHLVRFSNWHECQLEERTPPERVISLHRLLALKMWPVPPHMAHIIGFCNMSRVPGHCQNLGKSIQVVARADLAPPPVCPLLRPQSVHILLCISKVVFVNISICICFPSNVTNAGHQITFQKL